MDWDLTINITIVSVSISMVSFCIILLAHACNFIKIKFGIKWSDLIHKNASYVPLNDQYITDGTSTEMGSPAHVIQRRESLIYDVGTLNN